MDGDADDPDSRREAQPIAWLLHGLATKKLAILDVGYKIIT